MQHHRFKIQQRDCQFVGNGVQYYNHQRPLYFHGMKIYATAIVLDALPVKRLGEHIGASVSMFL